MREIHPNFFAYFVLLAWPAITLFLYARLPLMKATLWSILGGYLLLPAEVAIKIPTIPEFSKDTIPNLAVLLCCIYFARQRPKIFYGLGIAEICLLAMIASPFITSLLNTDPIYAGAFVVPGVGAYDAGSAVIFQFIYMIPFFLGRQFFRSAEDHVELMRALVVSGLAYSVLMLIEIRLSPQLNIWIYGYFPSGFAQELRNGGFRPVVFLKHGLFVAFFAMTATVAAATLWRLRIRVTRFQPGVVTAYLSFVLVLCKTVSAFLYAIFLVPLVRWARPALQLRIATILVFIALTYPVLRTADLIPTATILSYAYSLNADRAESLKTRFVQEKELLDKAWQRKWFGWGRYGRNRIYSDDPYVTRSFSITDGYWIITVGTFGLVGFVAVFGLISYIVFKAAGALKFAQTFYDQQLLATLSLLVAVNMIDLLPNSSISPWSWLLNGALLGRAEALYVAARRKVPATRPQLPSASIQGTPTLHG